MLSRVADCVFWMSRYIERAENAARFVDVNLNLTLDLGGTLANQWDPLIYTSGDHEQFYQRYGTANQKNAVAMLAFDEENPNSIVSCLKFARENARTVREIIAAPVWEELNKFYLLVKEAARNGRAADNPFEFFNTVKRSGQLIVGIMEATMSRGEAWHFAQMGRLLERADKTSRILDVKYYILLPSVSDVGTPTDAIQWSALLKSASALEMYRKRHGQITPTEVVEFLILNAEFPRALRFCLRGAEESLHAVTGTAPTTFRNQAERRLGQLRSELDYAQIGDIIERGLHEFIDSFQNNLNLVGDAIHTTFFAQRTVASPTSTRHGAPQ
ncbi:MAG TPA: alpha-E domain-containing protein [Pirellulales bacterium]|nr:alpha-E domain-containing protein [Pirellulales bacterium]